MKFLALLVVAATITGCSTPSPGIKAQQAKMRAALTPPKIARAENFALRAQAGEGILLQHWTATRWVVSAPVGKRLQAAVFEGQDGSGHSTTNYTWFSLPNFGTSGGSVTSNVPNVPHMNFRAVPSSKAGTAPVPKWFTEADKKK